MVAAIAKEAVDAVGTIIMNSFVFAMIGLM